MPSLEISGLLVELLGALMVFESLFACSGGPLDFEESPDRRLELRAASLIPSLSMLSLLNLPKIFPPVDTFRDLGRPDE